MKAEDLDAVFASEPEQAGEVTTPPPEAPKEPETAPEAPKAPEPAPEAPKEPEPKPSEAAERPEHTVPLPKYLDTRDENKELKRRLAELEAKERPAPKVPDPVDDPDGFRSHLKAEFQQELTAKTFEISDQMARQEHGAEAVEAAVDWALKKAESDRIFAAQYMQASHPIDWIVRQHKRDGLVSQLGDDPDAFVRRRAAELGLIAPPAGEASKPATEQPAEKPAAPTKSLIDQPSGGGVSTVPIGPTAGLDAVFPG